MRAAKYGKQHWSVLVENAKITKTWTADEIVDIMLEACNYYRRLPSGSLFYKEMMERVLYSLKETVDAGQASTPWD
jgi:hypothetical protein